MSTTFEFLLYYEVNNETDFIPQIQNSLLAAGFSLTYKDFGPVEVNDDWPAFKSLGGYYLNWEQPFYVSGYKFENSTCWVLMIQIHLKFFSYSNTKAGINQDDFLTTLIKLINLTKPFYAYSSSDEDWDITQKMPWELEHLKQGKVIDFFYWINYFSPEIVRHYGREQIYKGPFFKVTELKTEGLFILLNDKLVGGTNKFTRKDAIKYLNIDTSWKDKLMEQNK